MAMGVFSAGLGTALVTIASFVSTASSETQPTRPNIVLILADDMGYSDPGCYGGEIRTPNIDRLAEGGLRFTQFYNCAVCVTTRASLLYGVYPDQAGVATVGDRGCVTLKEDWTYGIYPDPPCESPNPSIGPADNCVSLAEVLRAAGYRTFMTGKWHGAHIPVERGFDRYYGLLSGCCNFFNPGLRRPGEGEPGRKRPGEARPWAIDGEVIQPYTPKDPDFYATDAFTEQALAYLDAGGRDERPFFLYLAYTAPHFPIHAWPEDIARYRGRYRVGWDALRRRRYERQVELGVIDPRWPLSPRYPGVPSWDEVDGKDDWDLKMAVYAAMIDRMDQGIGRVMAKLQELGCADNTLVLFLSDNGPCAEAIHTTPDVPPGPLESYHTVDAPWANVSDTPFRKFKMFVHEGGIATPLIAWWPKTIERPGEITHEVGHVIDFMPTFCELAGVAYPREFNGQAVQPTEGRSLLPVFQGRPREGHEALFWEHRGQRAVRSGRWKLVGCSARPWELYDLEADRTEQNDLAGAMPEKVEELADLYEQWARRVRQE